MMSNDNIVQFSDAALKNSSGRLLIPSRLTEARLAARLTQTELANFVDVSRQAISAYEKGEKKPTPEVMAELLKVLQQPLRFFTQDHEGSLTAPSTRFFRKFGSDTKRRNLACDIYASWFSDAVLSLEDMVNYPAVNLPEFEPSNSESSCYEDEEIEEIASMVRQQFGLGLGPISNVVRLIEANGVFVCRLNMPNENIEAFSYWADKRPFVILASDKNSACRARFDVAHELGHLVLHKWVGIEEIEDKTRLKQLESEANRFAGAFLLPRESFLNEVYSTRVESFVNLKARWKVAIQAMIYRCKDLGLIDDDQFIRMYKQISYKKWRKIEPLDMGDGAIPFEHPLLLRKVFEALVESNAYSLDAFLLRMAMSAATIETFFSLKSGTFKKEEDADFSFNLKPRNLLNDTE